MPHTTPHIRIFGALALSVLAVSGCRARSRHPVNPGARHSGGGTLSPGWTDVRPPNAGFACRMPRAPQMDGETGYDEDGSSYQTISARVTLPNGTLGVVVTEWEGGVVGDPLARAREIADSIVQVADSSDRRARRVTIPGFYAREDYGHTSEGAFFALRQFVGRDRLYVAVAAVTNDSVGLRTAEQFMSSIELDRRDALLPRGRSTRPVPLYLPDVDFAVNMPPLASRHTSEIEVDGATVDAIAFESRHPSGVYRVTVVQFAGHAPEGALVEVAERLSLGPPGAFTHTSGFPGRAFLSERDDLARAFVTERRVYVLEITAASRIGSVMTDAFFDSFRIL